MPVIRTRFLGPTTRRDPRIKASVFRRGVALSVTLPWDDNVNPGLNHHAAAQALAKREGLAGTWRCINDVDGGTLFIRMEETHEGFTVPDTRA